MVNVIVSALAFWMLARTDLFLKVLFIVPEVSVLHILTNSIPACTDASALCIDYVILIQILTVFPM